MNQSSLRKRAKSKWMCSDARHTHTHTHERCKNGRICAPCWVSQRTFSINIIIFFCNILIHDYLLHFHQSKNAIWNAFCRTTTNWKTKNIVESRIDCIFNSKISWILIFVRFFVASKLRMMKNRNVQVPVGSQRFTINRKQMFLVLSWNAFQCTAWQTAVFPIQINYVILAWYTLMLNCHRALNLTGMHSHNKSKMVWIEKNAGERGRENSIKK